MLRDTFRRGRSALPLTFARTRRCRFLRRRSFSSIRMGFPLAPDCRPDAVFAREPPAPRRHYTTKWFKPGRNFPRPQGPGTETYPALGLRPSVLPDAITLGFVQPLPFPLAKQACQGRGGG